MSSNKLVAVISILSLFAIALFINPTTNQSVRAEQVKSLDFKSSSISTSDAKDIVKTFQRLNSSNAVAAQYFGKDKVDKILAQPGCVGVRMYYGKNTNGKAGITLVGVDAEKNDILPVTIAGPTTLCPPYCGGGN
jgi:hypothetical protein